MLEQQISDETVWPFKGEIVDYPGTGKILVLIGYHKLEVMWGRAIKDQFEKNIQDQGRKVIFYELTDPQRAETGEDSRYANTEIARKMQEIGNVEMIIDLHEHPGALATEVRNSMSLTTGNPDVSKMAKEKIADLRTHHFDSYSRGKTGGEDVPYAITDPDLPKGGVDDYQQGKVSWQMQEALNDSLSFIVDLSNIQLANSETA